MKILDIILTCVFTIMVFTFGFLEGKYRGELNVKEAECASRGGMYVGGSCYKKELLP